MDTKCPKCGGELVQTTPEVAKCKECGAAFKRKAPAESQTNQKKSVGKSKGKKKGKHGILKTVAIVVLGLGILGALLPDSNEGDKKEHSEKKKEDSVWAEKDTDIEDFGYYVDGDKIYIDDYEGKDEKIKIGSSYDVDGSKKIVESISGAPFLGGRDINSAIISEGITTLDSSVFNSCGVKYVFLPSTLQNVDNHFWGYFHEVEKIYYGGTQEQWYSICRVARKDLDCKKIYCNVKVEELGEDDSKKEMVSMDANLQESEGGNQNENAGAENVVRVYGAIEDFSYEIQGDVVSLKTYNGNENIIELKPTYVIDGIEYRTDISDFYASGNSVGTVIIDEGFSEVNTAIFNSCGVHTVFFPRSMTNIYDYTLSYMHTSDGNLNKIYYAGMQDEWNAIFRHYERTKVEDAWAGKDPEQIGQSLADKINEMIGSEYKPEEFEYHFSASPEELKQ